MPLTLIDIQEINPRIEVDLKYATPDNFTKEILYDFKKCLLVKEAALKLSLVQEEFEAMGLGLKVWDGYRPMAVQWKFWNLIQDERYVSHPLKGGRHTRGTAVDLTIINKEGVELEMPTSFDDFRELAHRKYMDLPGVAIQNRTLLESIMKKHGFIGIETEWWHFDLEGWESYPPLEKYDCLNA